MLLVLGLMPQTGLVADVCGVVVVVIVCILILFGFVSICYSLYFRSQIHLRDYLPLGFFNGPWIIRITLVLIAIWWGIFEIFRLTLLRQSGKILHSLSREWQEHSCKFYLISNLGFAEPIFFLILSFLLHSSLRKREAGTLSPRWNVKTCGYVSILCFPVFVSQLVLLFIGTKLDNRKHMKVLPKYFGSSSTASFFEGHGSLVICTYPLLNTILHGIFTLLVLLYFTYFGVCVFLLVINLPLKRRIFILVLSLICLPPSRVLFLGLSVVSHPGSVVFELFVFLAFLAFLISAMLGIYMMVYRPIIDSLTVRDLLDTGVGVSLHLQNIEMDEVAGQSLLDDIPESTSSSHALMRSNCFELDSVAKHEDEVEGFEELGLPSHMRPGLSTSTSWVYPN